MTDEEILQIVWESLYGYDYILKEGRSKNYIPTVYEDIKYKLNNKNETTKK